MRPSASFGVGLVESFCSCSVVPRSGTRAETCAEAPDAAVNNAAAITLDVKVRCFIARSLSAQAEACALRVDEDWALLAGGCETVSIGVGDLVDPAKVCRAVAGRDC